MDWGDESTGGDEANADGVIEISHTYAVPGVYEVTVKNDEISSDNIVARATVTVLLFVDTD